MTYIERTLENNPVRLVTFPGYEMWNGAVVYIVCALDAVIKALDDFKNGDHKYERNDKYDSRQDIINVAIDKMQKLIDEFKRDCAI